MRLGLALQSNLAVDLGMDETQIGWLNVWSTVLAASGCVVGGLVSDRLGRFRMLAVYVVAIALPTLWLAGQLRAFDWILPRPKDASVVLAPAALIAGFWGAACVYNFVAGLLSGTRTAVYMGLCHSEVAGTQFTAYMSLMNLAFAYSAAWQGRSAQSLGYPTTLVIDALLGCVCLAPLALMARTMPRERTSASLDPVPVEAP